MNPSDPAGRPQDAFDLAELTLARAGEAGQWVGGMAAPAGHEKMQTALVGLHGRAVTIAHEVVALARGGYASGALSRWRALHEVWIVFAVLRDRDEALCHRYLEHAVIDELKLQEDYAQAWDTVGGPPPGFTSFERNRRRATLVMRFGNTFLREYGWAAPLFDGRPPRFRELQTLVQLEPLPGTRHGRFPPMPPPMPPPAPPGSGGPQSMPAVPTALIAVAHVTAGLLDFAADLGAAGLRDRLDQERAQQRSHAVIAIMERALDELVAVVRRPAVDGPGVSPSR